MIRFTSAGSAALLAIAAMVPRAGQAQLVNSTGTWSDMVTPTNSQVAFWDHASADGDNCNIGYFLVYSVGAGYGPCTNQKPGSAFVQANAGRLGVGAGGSPNGSFLSHTNFTFAPGKYRFEFLGEVAAFAPPGQQLAIYGNVASPTLLFPIYPVGTYPNSLTTIFELAIGEEWYLGANHASGGADYTTATGPDHGWALFSSRGANAMPGGYNDTMWASFGDVKGGDQDYNDLVLQITAVPEPGTILLMGSGLGALLVVVSRRRRVRRAA